MVPHKLKIALPLVAVAVAVSACEKALSDIAYESPVTIKKKEYKSILYKDIKARALPNKVEGM